MRSFIVFPADHIGVYLDWRTQEVGIAATMSGDPALMDAYRGGDVYYALARTCGFTTDPDPEHWKKNNPDMRQRMKTLQLGINYGMGVPSLARGLDRHPLIASGIIEQHRRIQPIYWQWRDDVVMRAMLDRRIESVSGWPLRITTSPNKRTLYNFPMQAGGAEMLRLAAAMQFARDPPPFIFCDWAQKLGRRRYFGRDFRLRIGLDRPPAGIAFE
jgi:DNA polymerase I-like protein with 3'-5' exonuclease and polymerase domains